jgi:RNA polymerase sigma-70 factor (ECF subfamily)
MLSSQPVTADANALLERARAGDQAALEDLLTSVAPAIHRFGLRLCQSAPDAEDVLQDTLLSIATHLHEFEARSALLSWVFALTRSACARRRRGLKNQRMANEADLPEPRDAAPSPEQQAAENEMTRALSRALDSLPEQYREVILLRDVEGLTAPDVAASLGVSVDAVKSRLHRAREALRSGLRPLLEASAPPPTATCPDVVARWSKKLEGDLSQGDCAAMEAHLAICPACGAACDALKRALLACRRSASTELRPEVQARVKAAIRAWTALRA